MPPLPPHTCGVGPARVDLELVARHALDAALGVGLDHYGHVHVSGAGAVNHVQDLAHRVQGCRFHMCQSCWDCKTTSVAATTVHGPQAVGFRGVHHPFEHTGLREEAEDGMLLPPALLPRITSSPTARGHTFGRPSLVLCSPAAPGSTPVSRMATITPRPSYSGCSCSYTAARQAGSAARASRKKSGARPMHAPVHPAPLWRPAPCTGSACVAHAVLVVRSAHLEEAQGADLLLGHGP